MVTQHWGATNSVPMTVKSVVENSVQVYPKRSTAYLGYASIRYIDFLRWTTLCLKSMVHSICKLLATSAGAHWAAETGENGSGA